MQDRELIDLLWERNETALFELSRRYSPLYRSILSRILREEGDVEECANDVLLAVWNSIPPHRPQCLSAYLSKIAGRIGINRLKYNTRQKRSPEYLILLSELGDCLPDAPSREAQEEEGEIIRGALTRFLKELDPESEILFLRRYFYLETVAELARRFEQSENRISVKLYRARRKLKKILEKEGIRI